MKHYDAIVLGIGGVGSAALAHLAQRGIRVVGIDRFDPPHDRGSTHGHTRIIRQAYFEHPNYVPLLKESYRLWRELEEWNRKKLYQECGLIEIGPPNGTLVPGVLRSAAEHELDVERMTVRQIQDRWPGLAPSDDVSGVYEAKAGYLLVEECVNAHLKMAREAGAELMVHTSVREWRSSGREVRVQTDRGELAADRLLITAGAWASQMLATIKTPLIVRRKSLFWFAGDTSQYDSNRFPAFLFEIGANSPETKTRRSFYGFPKIDDRGIKIAEHTGGQSVEDPLAVDRSIDRSEQERVMDVISKWLPNLSHRLTDHAVCLYTMSPDEHFIVDRHPEFPNVVFAAGLSGHGFKFATVLGLALAELAADGRTRLPIDFLSLKRFAASQKI
jgi:monomeric sarcosine oxidase